MRAQGHCRKSLLTMQIYVGHLPQPTSDDFLCTCLAGSSRALGRVRIWQLRIVVCLTLMQRYRCSVCPLIAKDCRNYVAGLGGSVGCASDWRPGGRGFDPRRGRQQSFVEIDHEIFSTVILSLLLIQEGQMSVSGARMCTILVNR